LFKLHKNTFGLIEVNFAMLGLFIATAVLVSAVVSAVFTSDWQRQAELESIAHSFAHFIEGMDARAYDNTSTFHFPDKGYSYTASISSEYIVMKAKGFWNNDVIVTKRFVVRPWMQGGGDTVPWVGCNELHSDYLSSPDGTYDDPI